MAKKDSSLRKRSFLPTQTMSQVKIFLPYLQNEQGHWSLLTVKTICFYTLGDLGGGLKLCGAMSYAIKNPKISFNCRKFVLSSKI